jgi:hypothetical protein
MDKIEKINLKNKLKNQNQPVLILKTLTLVLLYSLFSPQGYFSHCIILK